MKQLATRYRTGQLLAQEFHHNTQGDTFYQDHAAFESHYEAYADAYDALIERMKGTGVEFNESRIGLSAATACVSAKRGKTPNNLFQSLLDHEQALLAEIAKCSPTLSIGSQNLVAQLADDAEVRIYKLRQRLGV
jgi:DNA-binding ferritin-like protein